MLCVLCVYYSAALLAGKGFVCFTVFRMFIVSGGHFATAVFVHSVFACFKCIISIIKYYKT